MAQKTSPSSISLSIWVGTFYIAICGGLFIIYVTRWGVGFVDWDSFNYLSAARNLAAGQGLTVQLQIDRNQPLTHFPPLFPILLALFEQFGIDAVIAARWLNSVLFGVSVFLFALLIWEVTSSRWMAGFSALLFILSPDLIYLHAWALSEPLLITLTLACFLMVHRFFHQGSPRQLIGAGVLAGAAALTKYVGLSIVVTIVLVLVFRKNNAIRRKIGDIVTISLIGLLPISMWTYRVYTLTGTLNNRTLGFHPLTQGNMDKLFDTFYSWFLPERVVEAILAFLPTLTLGFIILGLSGCLLYKTRSGSSPFSISAAINSPSMWVWMYILFNLIYLAVVILSKIYFDPLIGLNDRMFVPVLVAMLLLAVAGLDFLITHPNHSLRFLGLGMAGYLLLMSGRQALVAMPVWHETGLGLNTKAIQQSVSVRLLAELSQSKAVYSNSPNALYLQTQNPGYMISRFPPEGATTGEVILVIFSYVSPGGHPLVDRFSDELRFIQQDRFATIYSYQASP